MDTTLLPTLTENDNILTTSNALERLALSPSKRENLEADQRAPLKELSDNKELLNQDQPEQSQEGEDGVEKINDYVSKIMEKLTSQKNKVAKMNETFEKSSKGLIVAQEIEEFLKNQPEEDEEEEEDSSAKENLSPVRTRHSTRMGMPGSPERKHHSPSVSEKSSPTKSAPKFQLEDVLEVSRSSINYGMKMPGQISEERLEIVNNSSHDFIVQILVNCKNEELQDTEEYVFSVRRAHLYDYNDRHYLIMAPHSRAEFKFALKIPNMRITGTIEGEVDISIQGLEGRYLLDLTAEAVVPKVFCPKELNNKGLGCKIINVAVKEGKKQELKIPFRNTGPIPVTLDFEFYEPKSQQDQEKPMFDCHMQPTAITIQPNATAMSNLVVKPWKMLAGLSGLGKQRPYRKIVIAKARDTAVVYSFIFCIEIC